MAIQEYTTKSGRRWRASLYMDGARVDTKRGFKTKREANKWLVDRERELISGQKEKKTGTAFGSLASDYLDDMKVRRRPNTYTYKKTVINRFLEFMGGDFILEDLSAQDIDAYMLSLAQGESPKPNKTINRDIKELSILLNWAIKKDRYHRNLFRLAEPYPEEAYQRYVPTAEDIAAARMAADPEERDWFDALYFTGARLGEIAWLRWEDVNFDKRTITLWTRKRRGGAKEPRTMAMTPSLYDLLWRRWKSPEKDASLAFPTPDNTNQNRSGKFLRTFFTRICDRAGVRRFTAHSIRHHVATRLKDSKKLTSYQIQHFLGHQNHRTTEIYLHELDVDPAAADVLETSITGALEESEKPAV